MSETLRKAGVCPQCGAATRPLVDTGGYEAPAGPLRHDLAALALEAASDSAYDESVKVRVTQDDIRNLLDKRRKAPK